MTENSFTALQAVRLTPSAQTRYPDIGDRIGVVLRVDGWPVIQWRGMDGETRVGTEDLDILTKCTTNGQE